MADAKFFSEYLQLARAGGDADRPARGKTQELRVELQQSNDKRDKGFTKKKVALKKIVANMTMGNDSECLVQGRRVEGAALAGRCGSDGGGEESWQQLTKRVVSPLFPDMVQCMTIQVLEIKKSELVNPNY
jgi:AP-2 complex subunit beta-1